MPRQLMFWEKLTLNSLVSSDASRDSSSVHVVEENFSAPRRNGRQWFNTDFMLQFVSALPLQQEFGGGAFPIRRNSIGAELFLLLDDCANPLRLELLNGESTPLSSYERELAQIEDAISEFGIDDWKLAIRSAELLRIFEFDRSIIFLASTTPRVSSFSVASPLEFNSDRAQIQTRRQGDGKIIEGEICR